MARAAGTLTGETRAEVERRVRRAQRSLRAAGLGHAEVAGERDALERALEAESDAR